MNCSESRRLQRLLSRLWQELRGSSGGPAPSNGSSLALGPTGGSAAPSKRAGDDAYLYILLIMIFYGCLAGGLILAYTRSRKLESKHDPYHLYIESDWGSAPGLAEAAATTTTATGQAPHRERHSSADSERP